MGRSVTGNDALIRDSTGTKVTVTDVRSEMRQQGERYSASAVEKACVLLAAFGHGTDTVVGVSELARRSGLTKSTTFRQLGILERASMVERRGNGYRIGQGLRALARDVFGSEHAVLTDALMPYLVEVVEITRHAVQLVVLEGSDVVYVGKLRGHRSVAAPLRLGSRMPAYRTAGGKLLLAYQSVSALGAGRSSVGLGLRAVNEVNPQLSSEFAEIRRRGVAFDIGTTNSDLSCVAAPVASLNGEPIAALSVCAPSTTNMTAIAALLRRVALAASQQLRLPVTPPTAL